MKGILKNTQPSTTNAPRSILKNSGTNKPLPPAVPNQSSVTSSHEKEEVKETATEESTSSGLPSGDAQVLKSS